MSTTAGITLNRKYPNQPDGGDPKQAVKGGSKEHLEQRKLKTEKEEHGLHVIVASEPTTFRANEWTLLEKNHGEYSNILARNILIRFKVIMVDEKMQPIVEELKVEGM